MKILITSDEDFKKVSSILDQKSILWCVGQKASEFNPVYHAKYGGVDYPYVVCIDTINHTKESRISFSNYPIVDAVSTAEYCAKEGYVEKKTKVEPPIKAGVSIIINTKEDYDRFASHVASKGVLWQSGNDPLHYNPVNRGWLNYPYYIKFSNELRLTAANLRGNELRLTAANLRGTDYNTFFTISEFFNDDQENEVTAEYKDGIITISDIEYDMVVPKELIVELYNKLNA